MKMEKEMTHPAVVREIVEKSLSEEIRVSYARAMSLVGETRVKGREAVCEAIRCGHLLNKAKKDTKHGRWLAWLRVNRPEISEDTAERWMRLANSAHVRNIEQNAASMRQAYILAGIIPEAEAHTGRTDATVQQVIERLSSPIGKVRQWFAVRMQRTPIEEWSPEERTLTKQQLEPLVQLYQQLG